MPASTSFALFISYAGADKDITIDGKRIRAVNELKRCLEQHVHPTGKEQYRKRRFRVCTYEEDFDLDETVRAEIRSKLEQSNALLVLCSSEAADSEYVQFEIETFAEMKPDRPIVGAAMTLLPERAFPKYFKPDQIGADLQLKPGMSQREWRRQLRMESHKIVAAAWGLSVTVVHNRFEAARRRRRISILAVAATVLILLFGLYKFDRMRRAAGVVDRLLSLEEDSGQLLPDMQPLRPEVIKNLSDRPELKPVGVDAAKDDRINSGKRRAAAASAAIRLSDDEAALHHLRRSSEDPETITQFAAGCKDSQQIPQADVARFLKYVHDQSQTPSMDADARDEMSLVCYGTLLALGDYHETQLSESLMKELRAWYQQHPDAGVHAAIGWLLRQYGQGATVDQLDAQMALSSQAVGSLSDLKERSKKNWFVMKLVTKEDVGDQPMDLITFTLFQDGKLVFAVADRETTFRICSRLDETKVFKYRAADNVSKIDPLQDHPANNVKNMSVAQRICEAFTNEFLSPTLRAHLPDSSQWALAWGRGSHGPVYQFGVDEGLLNRYAVYFMEGGEHRRTHPAEVATLRPSATGMYDMHGNVAEWTKRKGTGWRGGTYVSGASGCEWGREDTTQQRGLRFFLSNTAE